jgi:iron(III) transport system ATP-binding protein
MDEPFSGLDPRLREKMREETLAILHETRATSIIVTHDAEEAMRMGDRVALMRAGAIVQTGTALDLYRAPKDILAARTFSDLNELPARVEQGNAATPLGGFFANGLPDGADAIVCVRQRGVRLLAAGQGVPACSMRASSAMSPWSSLPCRDSTILARVRESDAPPQGAEIGVSIDTGAVLVFEAEKRGAGPLTISWSAACDGGAFTAIVP